MVTTLCSDDGEERIDMFKVLTVGSSVYFGFIAILVAILALAIIVGVDDVTLLYLTILVALVVLSWAYSFWNDRRLLERIENLFSE